MPARKRATAPTPKRNPKTGKWYFSFDSQYPKPDGSRRQIYRQGFATMGEAKDEMKRLMDEDRPSGKLTVERVLDRFVTTKTREKRAPNTIRGYRDAAARIKARWGGWDAEALTGDHLDAAYTEWLASGKLRGGGTRRKGQLQPTVATKKGLSARSVQLLHVTLKAAYALELKRRDTPLRWNPADEATAPTVVVAEQRRSWWTPEQMAQFLAYDADPEHDDLPTGMVDMLADTGGRNGETCAARWADIDLDAGTFTVTKQIVYHPDLKLHEQRRTKRKRDVATINLHPVTVAKLKLRRKEQAAERLRMGAGWPKEGSVHHDLVFTWPDGTMITPGQLRYRITRMSVAAGLPRLTPHGIRHTFATAALKNRVRVELVAHRLGNTVPVVQQIYSHVIPADDADVAQTVGDLFRPQQG